MKTFKEFSEEVAANSVAGGGVDVMDPIVKFKMFRRKSKKNKEKL